jgi:hypothetical protein
LTLKARLYDEDPDDYDDRLGKVEVETGAINEHFSIKEETYKVRKTGANFKAYALRSCLRLVDKAHDLHARLVLSVEVLGKTKEEVGKVYTVNNFWWIHYSPIIGRIAGTKTNDEQGVEKFKWVETLAVLTAVFKQTRSSCGARCQMRCTIATSSSRDLSGVCSRGPASAASCSTRRCTTNTSGYTISTRRPSTECWTVPAGR